MSNTYEEQIIASLNAVGTPPITLESIRKIQQAAEEYKFPMERLMWSIDIQCVPEIEREPIANYLEKRLDGLEPLARENHEKIIEALRA